MTKRYKNFREQLNGLDREMLKQNFDAARPATLVEPIPAGEYLAKWTDSGIRISQKHIPYLMGRFEITSGKYYGRKFTRRWYLSEAALPYTKRELLNLGGIGFEQLEEKRLPREEVRLQVVIKKNENGEEYNLVTAVLPNNKKGHIESPWDYCDKSPCSL